MAKASALLVGLKSVDPTAYGGWDGTNGCWGCELDVDNMERLLTPLGYQIKTLKTAEATRDNILSSLYRAAENASSDDIFVFYFSGHGGQQPNIVGDELDGKDETLVAYDREVIDDKIHEALLKFRAGVRLIMISDSCNSGTNYKGIRTVAVNENSIFRPLAKNRDNDINIKAQLIHLGGCRDGFTSVGYLGGGAFTKALCDAWQNGAFNGSLKELHAKICEIITSNQKPQYTEYGPVSDEFSSQKAFVLSSTAAVAGPVELPVVDMTPTQANISHAGEKHEYKFIAVKAGTYVIETEGRTDLLMSLYGPDDPDKLICKDDDSGEGLNPKIVADLAPGEYYPRIQHYSSENGTGSYSIKVYIQSS